MPHHARIAALLAAPAMILGLTAYATTGESTPGIARALSGSAGPTDASEPAPAAIAAPTASPTQPIPGESVTLAGSVGSSRSTGATRTVALQTFTDGTWHATQEQAVTASGRYSFRVEQSAWTARWRVLAPSATSDASGDGETSEPDARASQPRTLFGQIQHATTSMPRSVHVGERAKITLFASPVRPGRTLTLQRDSGHGWKDLADLTADRTGHATYTAKATSTGKTRYRTIARATHGAPALIEDASALYTLEKRPVGVMAWRGDSADHPENSLEAYRSAVRNRADFIEMDFQPTSDGDWVMMHDSDLQRTTDVETRFPDRKTESPRAFTRDEIKQLDAGSWKGPQFRGTRVPTIEETFDAIDAAEKTYGHRVRILLDLKGENAAEMQALYRKVVALRPGWVDPKSHDDKAVFMSFDQHYFDFPGARSSGMERVAVKDDPDPADSYRAGYDQVHISTKLLNASLVRHYHREGSLVGTWPAVGTPEVLRAAAAGVDYVTTDDVATARRVLLR